MREIRIIVTDTAVSFPDGQELGRVGEHNATQLIIELPDDMVAGVDYHVIKFSLLGGTITSDIITDDDSKIIYISDGKIYCTLWQQLTASRGLSFTVEAYKVVDGTPSRIAKSPLVSGLRFELSAGADSAGADVDEQGYSLAVHVNTLDERVTAAEGDIADLQEAEHTHENKSTLDGFSAYEGILPTYNEAIIPRMTVDTDYGNGTIAIYNSIGMLTSAENSEGQPLLATEIVGTIDKTHEHPNKELLDAYTNADADISSAVLNSHTPSAVATFADLPATALKDEKCNVCSDVAQLTFSTYASLMFNPSPVDVPLFFAGTSRLGLYSFVDPEDANGGDCVVFSTTSDDFGNKFLQIIAIVGGVIYNYFSRDVTLLSSQYTAGWHDGNDIPCAAPTLTDFTVLRIEHGTTQYTAAADLTADVLSALRSASAVLNTSTAEMHMRGVYVFDGTASWTREHDENELELYTGTLCANHRYYATLGDDLTLTLPSSATLDKSRDNSILMYLNCTADIDITFADALYYGRALPDTTQGTHEIIAAYNVGAGKWQIGALETGAVS